MQWLYNLFKEQKGGVLGDDMGLGKTVQISAYLKGLFNADIVSKILIIAPTTIINNWVIELRKWCPGIENIVTFEDKNR